MHNTVGTEHLLLGVLAEEKGIVAQVLTEAGVSLQAARAETLRLLGTEEPATGPGVPAAGIPLAGRREHGALLCVRASQLVTELLSQPPPDASRVRQIGSELKALVDELAELM